MTLLNGFHHVFVLPIARAEHNDLNVRAHNVVDHRSDKVESLLLGEPCHHCDERTIFVKGQIDHFANCLFVFRFLDGVVFDGIICKQSLVRLWIVKRLIYAVDNPV